MPRRFLGDYIPCSLYSELVTGAFEVVSNSIPGTAIPKGEEVRLSSSVELFSLLVMRQDSAQWKVMGPCLE